MDTGDTENVQVIVESPANRKPTNSLATATAATEKTALVPRHSYYFYRVKRKRTEDAVDICEIEKNGFINSVTAVKSSSVFRSPLRCHDDHKSAIHFECKIVEPFGDEILTMKGYQSFICCGSTVYAEFRKFGQLLGSVEVINNEYHVKGKDREPVCKVVGPSRCDLVFLPCILSPMEFRILLPDGTEIGRLGSKWEENIPFKAARNQFGVCLPGDLDEPRQWLILGSSLLIRWQFWRPFSNGLWCLSFTALIVLVLVGIAIALYMLLFYEGL